jgi:2-amino-4-hydroxy-6-hydroxymethyldihydropteridine diphosphokinase
MGFAGDPFWNLVVSATTDLSVGGLQAAIREIEYRHGRALDAVRNSPRALDIDILSFGDAVGEIDGVICRAARFSSTHLCSVPWRSWRRIFRIRSFKRPTPSSGRPLTRRRSRCAGCLYRPACD